MNLIKTYTHSISFKLLFLLCILSVNSLIKAAEIPVIAAASSIKFALNDIQKAFHQDTGKNIRISYGASGNLSRQIKQGAPFELFLSANNDYVKQLYQQQRTPDTGISYALGRIVLIAKKNTSIPLDNQLNGVKKTIKSKQLKHFAIANPIHAPYGRAAREILQHLDLWTLVKPHLVLGENVAQATQFVSSGGAQVGLTSYSLALSSALKGSTQSLLIPTDWHKPLKQTAVLLNGAGETAKLFYTYLQQNKAQQILAQYGYQ